MCKTSERVNELVKAETFDVDEACALIDEIAEQMARLETIQKNFKEKYRVPMAVFMRENEIKSFRTKKGTLVSYKPAYDALVADSAKMKEDGIFNAYAKVRHNEETIAIKGAK